MFDWFGSLVFDALTQLFSGAILNALGGLFLVDYWTIFTGWFGM